MQSRDKIFYYQASASPLGGQMTQPYLRPIPSPASSALSAAGGFASSESEAFNHQNIVSFTAARTRISGHEAPDGGEFSTLVTTVVEGLNILEIVTAKRVVAQLSVAFPKDGGPRRIATAGSHFEGLRIGGYDANPEPNGELLRAPLTVEGIRGIGVEQSKALTDKAAWLTARYGWTKRGQKGNAALTMCSLLNAVSPKLPGRSFGHVIVIPDFGRIFLGELLVSHSSAQLSMVRAELGCNVHATLTVSVAGTGGTTMPPGKSF
jgi:hypothetical protein